MATIKEYIKIYKNLSFEECDLNINDIIIFSELSYIDWSNIVPPDNTKITLGEAGKLYFQTNKPKDKYLSVFVQNNIENLKNIITGKRYKNIRLAHYKKYVDKEKQFGAICIYFEKEKVFVSFEGTDDTVIGWKEDFVLGYHFPIISQNYAVDYLNEVITDEDKVIYVGGHSKGGNLAMTASMYAKDDIFDRIKYIYNLDGPGFREKEYSSKEFKKILSKLQMYVPEDSIIGMLLYNTNDYTVVKSVVKGLKQHNCNTWQCFGSFLEEGKLSKFSIKINNKIKIWSKKYSDEKLEKMIITFFSILENNNIESFYELKKILHKLNLSTEQQRNLLLCGYFYLYLFFISSAANRITHRLVLQLVECLTGISIASKMILSAIIWGFADDFKNGVCSVGIK